MGLLLVWTWVKEKIMPLGAFKAALMGTAGVSTETVVLLSSQTITSGSSISFTSGIDSTYGEYIFRFYNINGEGTGPTFDCLMSDDGGSSYGVTKTTTFFTASHAEADSTSFSYSTDEDIAQGTSPQSITGSQNPGADASMAGELHLFNPSSTTYVKHFYSQTISMGETVGAKHTFTAGYVNATAVVDAIKFQFANNDYDGTIKMWGVK